MSRPVSALQLFRDGFDTIAISDFLRITEAEALKQLSRERSAELGVSDPYDHSHRNLSVRVGPDHIIQGRQVFVRPNRVDPDWFQGVVSGGRG